MCASSYSLMYWAFGNRCPGHVSELTSTISPVLLCRKTYFMWTFGQEFRYNLFFK